MNVDSLFEKISVDLSAFGAQEGDADGARVLEYDGTPFVRLTDERMAFRFAPGCPGHDDALALATSTPGESGWVEVDADDVSEWPRLAQQALTSLRR